MTNPEVGPVLLALVRENMRPFETLPEAATRILACEAMRQSKLNQHRAATILRCSKHQMHRLRRKYLPDVEYELTLFGRRPGE